MSGILDYRMLTRKIEELSERIKTLEGRVDFSDGRIDSLGEDIVLLEEAQSEHS